MSHVQLFTPRFVKDLFILAIFFGGFYLLTNNPFTHPSPEEARGFWSIQLMQQPLVFGIAGHNFLTLRNEKNIIVGELHGLATNAVTGAWKYTGDDSTDKLRVWYFKSPHEYITQKNYAGTLLFKGSKNDAINLWEKAVDCGEKINTRALLYPPYGVKVNGETENSNSVAYTLMLCMELDAERLGLITPGWGKNLLDDRIQTNR